MKKIYLLVMVIAFTHVSCNKGRDCGCVMPYQVYYLKAEVIQTSNIDCGKPLLSFTEDSIRIKQITGKNNSIEFIAIGLPSSFNQLHKKLYVNAAVLKPEEDFPCTTLGIAYPHIKLLDAIER